MTAEKELIQRYFGAFNSHDIDGVMALNTPVVRSGRHFLRTYSGRRRCVRRG